jgi:hypothetical protein
MESLNSKTADSYGPAKPSTADLMECIWDNAQNLSTAIKAANRRGLIVHVEASLSGSENQIQIVYSC